MIDEPALSPAEALKARLRDDLRLAMRRRAVRQTAVLRVCIAAIDNAEAPPAGEAHQRYEARPFGDGCAEVPRLHLDEAALEALLIAEIAARKEAAADFSRTGALIRAKELRDDADVIARYLPSRPKG